MVPPKGNTAQSRASPREEKSHGRFSLKAPKGQVRLDTKQRDILNDQPEGGSIGPGSVCNNISMQLPCFISWCPDPLAEATDTFLQEWKMMQGCVHPPWCLIARVLCKVQMEEASLVLVAPPWQSQSWFPQLEKMLIDSPILLPREEGVVEPSLNCDCPVAAVPPQLVACKVSGCASKQRECQKRLSPSSWPLGDPRQICQL